MNKKQRILLIEDDVRLADLICEYLTDQEYDVSVLRDGTNASEIILNDKPDLVVLDLMLPGKDGLVICREVRGNYAGSILILTAMEDDIDQVAGLELGADDYVKKPIKPRVLLARIRALLRRSQHPIVKKQSPQSELKIGTLLINKSSRDVTLSGKPIPLTTNEYDMLCFLAENSGIVLSRDEISTFIRGFGYDGIDRSIDICISRLRKKLSDNTSKPYRIKTVWGSGYLFVSSAWEV